MARFSPPSAWDATFGLGDPQFDSVCAAADRFRAIEEWPSVEELDGRLRDMVPVRFVRQGPKPRGRRRAPVSAETLYDGTITVKGQVPTRDRSWHDLMNALVWASFPRSKLALHARQYQAAVARLGGPVDRLPGARSPEQDALTMLDEGGELVLVADAAEARALAEGGPAALSAALAKGTAAKLVFGHALLEHALAGERSVRPKRVFLAANEPLSLDLGGRRCLADRSLAAWLTRGGA